MYQLNSLQTKSHQFLPPQRRLRLVALQAENRPVRNVTEQYQVTREQLALIGQLRGQADAVFLPEDSAVGFPLDAGYLSQGQAAERPGGPIQQMFANAAKEFGLLIGFGLPLVRDGGLFQSYIVTDGSGPLAVCDKQGIDLYRHYFEGRPCPGIPGRGYTNFSWRGTEISLLICRDFLDEELRLAATSNRPDLLVMPCYTTTAGHYDILVQKLPTSLLTVNFAEAECGHSTIYEQTDGFFRKTSLDRAPGLLYTVI